MDTLLILLYLTLAAIALVGLPVAIGLLLKFFFRRIGRPKTGKYVVWAYVLSIIFSFACIMLEDFLFTKRAAQELVEEQQITLTDDFDLVENQSSSPFVIGSDYYHTFTLNISQADAQRAIESIKNSPKFIRQRDSVNSMLYMRAEGRYKGPTITQEYEKDGWYVREYFKPDGRENYAPTFRRICISASGNRLKFEDIME